MTVLILCNKDDQVALSLFHRLENTNEPAALIMAEDLAIAGWKQLIGSTGVCSTEISLQNGNVIRSRELKAVFNRIRYLPMPHFIDEKDRLYAEMEIFALFVSFLKNIQHALINPIYTNQLLPDADNDLLNRMQATQAGLPVCDYHLTSAPRWQSTKGMVPMPPQKISLGASYKESPDLVWANQPVLFLEAYDHIKKAVVVGENILGELPSKYVTAVKNLSHITGIPFLEIYMVDTSTGIKLGEVNKFPLIADLPVIEALAGLMLQKINQFE